VLFDTKKIHTPERRMWIKAQQKIVFAKHAAYSSPFTRSLNFDDGYNFPNMPQQSSNDFDVDFHDEL